MQLTDINPVLFLGIVFVIAFVIIVLLRTTKSQFPLNYARQTSLFTSYELSFYKHLIMLLADTNLYICPKVRLIDLIKIREKGKYYWKARNVVISKHIDFVLCNKNDMSIVCVIELDDKTHHRQGRVDRDALVNNILTKAGIPIFHIRNANNLEDLKKQILLIQS